MRLIVRESVMLITFLPINGSVSEMFVFCPYFRANAWGSRSDDCKL